LKALWHEDLLGRLPYEVRRDLSNVKLLIPLVGAHKHPFDYYFNLEKKSVTMPILTVKFMDDIAIALAWMERRGCSKKSVYDYIGALRYQNPGGLNGGRFPTPLKALKIPSNALDDSFVNDVSGKILKSTIYFKLAQQLGHIRYKHRGIQFVSANEAQEQIIKADAFALELMKRISVPPVGMSIYFRAVSRFDKAPGDFESVEDYEVYLRKVPTYPLTPSRLNAFSKFIKTNANMFTRAQQYPELWRKKVLDLANDFNQISEELNSPEIRKLYKHRNETVTLNDLATACD